MYVSFSAADKKYMNLSELSVDVLTSLSIPNIVTQQGRYTQYFRFKYGNFNLLT